jgi:hypothetical protein
MAKAGGLLVRGQPGLCSEFKASMVCLG